ncbi:P-loop containing nucleoside triphosphate hydrolase protein [Mycena amicta]|nr:P-loop containing nucleoside triphosphate hydrolase protein [Mycena amicta]
MSPVKFTYNLVVVGGRSVGKTALTVRFIMDHYAGDEPQGVDIDWSLAIDGSPSFTRDAAPWLTILPTETSTRQCVLDEELTIVNVFDPAPEPAPGAALALAEYPAPRQPYILRGHGFLLVYAVNDRGSLEQLAELHEKILLVKDRDKVPMIVVAAKCDLKSERAERIVEDDDRLGCSFFETSAKQGTNVDEAFFGLVREEMPSDVAVCDGCDPTMIFKLTTAGAQLSKLCRGLIMSTNPATAPLANVGAAVGHKNGIDAIIATSWIDQKTPKGNARLRWDPAMMFEFTIAGAQLSKLCWGLISLLQSPVTTERKNSNDNLELNSIPQLDQLKHYAPSTSPLFASLSAVFPSKFKLRHKKRCLHDHSSHILHRTGSRRDFQVHRSGCTIIQTVPGLDYDY